MNIFNFFKKPNCHLNINDFCSKFRMTKDFVIISSNAAKNDSNFKDSYDILTGLRKADIIRKMLDAKALTVEQIADILIRLENTLFCVSYESGVAKRIERLIF